MKGTTYINDIPETGSESLDPPRPMEFKRIKYVALVLLVLLLYSCQNKHQLDYSPIIDEYFTVDYCDNWFIVSNKEECDTFYFFNGEVFDNEKRLFMTTKRDTIVRYQFTHYQIRREIEKKNEKEFECKIYIEDEAQKRFVSSFIYDDNYMIRKIRRICDVDFTLQ